MAEFEARLDIFKENHALIEAHNATDSSFKMGHNYMSTWTDVEY